MTQPKSSKPTHEGVRDKAATTTAAALHIIGRERIASDAKVARLKALRLDALAARPVVLPVTVKAKKASRPRSSAGPKAPLTL